MTEDEMYEKVCKSRFDKIEELLTSIDQRLFKDNGGNSFQSKLNRQDNWIKRTNKIIWTLALAVLAIIVGWVKSKFFS